MIQSISPEQAPEILFVKHTEEAILHAKQLQFALFK